MGIKALIKKHKIRSRLKKVSRNQYPDLFRCDKCGDIFVYEDIGRQFPCLCFGCSLELSDLTDRWLQGGVDVYEDPSEEMIER